ncbi:hypothetical protein M885DRAFT_47535 [Pelagophyceae sp. CCMP2097]|nr:hypothetical protein M885DRAFT_47535 [Pelagophyceae sp. CCMP2097]
MVVRCRAEPLFSFGAASSWLSAPAGGAVVAVCACGGEAGYVAVLTAASLQVWTAAGHARLVGEVDWGQGQGQGDVCCTLADGSKGVELHVAALRFGAPGGGRAKAAFFEAKRVGSAAAPPLGLWGPRASAAFAASGDPDVLGCGDVDVVRIASGTTIAGRAVSSLRRFGGGVLCVTKAPMLTVVDWAGRTLAQRSCAGCAHAVDHVLDAACGDADVRRGAFVAVLARTTAVNVALVGAWPAATPSAVPADAGVLDLVPLRPPTEDFSAAAVGVSRCAARVAVAWARGGRAVCLSVYAADGAGKGAVSLLQTLWTSDGLLEGVSEVAWPFESDADHILLATAGDWQLVCLDVHSDADAAARASAVAACVVAAGVAAPRCVACVGLAVVSACGRGLEVAPLARAVSAARAEPPLLCAGDGVHALVRDGVAGWRWRFLSSPAALRRAGAPRVASRRGDCVAVAWALGAAVAQISNRGVKWSELLAADGTRYRCDHLAWCGADLATIDGGGTLRVYRRRKGRAWDALFEVAKFFATAAGPPLETQPRAPQRGCRAILDVVEQPEASSGGVRRDAASPTKGASPTEGASPSAGEGREWHVLVQHDAGALGIFAVSQRWPPKWVGAVEAPPCALRSAVLEPHAVVALSDDGNTYVYVRAENGPGWSRQRADVDALLPLRDVGVVALLRDDGADLVVVGNARRANARGAGDAARGVADDDVDAGAVFVGAVGGGDYAVRLSARALRGGGGGAAHHEPVCRLVAAAVPAMVGNAVRGYGGGGLCLDGGLEGVDDAGLRALVAELLVQPEDRCDSDYAPPQRVCRGRSAADVAVHADFEPALVKELAQCGACAGDGPGAAAARRWRVVLLAARASTITLLRVVGAAARTLSPRALRGLFACLPSPRLFFDAALARGNVGVAASLLAAVADAQLHHAGDWAHDGAEALLLDAASELLDACLRARPRATAAALDVWRFARRCEQAAAVGGERRLPSDVLARRIVADLFRLDAASLESAAVLLADIEPDWPTLAETDRWANGNRRRALRLNPDRTSDDADWCPRALDVIEAALSTGARGGLLRLLDLTRALCIDDWNVPRPAPYSGLAARILWSLRRPPGH